MVDWLFQHLRPGMLLVIRHPLKVFGICAISAIVGFLLAKDLRIDNDLSKLIPPDYPSMQALNTLREQVGGEHEAAVAIHSPSFEINKSFAESFIPRALQLINPETGEPYFTRAEFRRNIDILKNNALYFATDEELNQPIQGVQGVRASST